MGRNFYTTAAHTNTTHGEPPTPGQLKFATDLITANFTGDHRDALLATLPTLTKRTISPKLDLLVSIDRANAANRGNTPTPTRPARTIPKTFAQQDAELPPVPAGRYTVNGHHYKIDRPTEGHWAGRTFIREIDTHGNEIADVRDHPTKLTLTTTIATDPYAHMTAYGLATEVCGKCQTSIKDPESIARGIGPYCEANMRGISVSAVYRNRRNNPTPR